MKNFLSIILIIALTSVSCHRVYIGGGTTYPTGSGYVSVGGSINTDDSGAAIIAASLLGILVGSAIYNDVYSYREKGLSAYDINIKPKDADIYLDGLYVGKADDFDGSPKFLVVKPGTHTITAKKEGYRVYTVKVAIEPGEQINLNKRLEPVSRSFEENDMVKPDKVEREKQIFKKAYVRFDVKDDNAKVYFDNTFVGTIGEIKKLHKPLIVEDTVKYIYIESNGVRIRFSLSRLIEQQGKNILIKPEF